MARSTNSDAARSKGQEHFTATQRRDASFRSMIEHERETRDAKNAKLRALRLAKEAADKIEADRAAALAEPQKAQKKRAARKKKVAGAK